MQLWYSVESKTARDLGLPIAACNGYTDINVSKPKHSKT